MKTILNYGAIRLPESLDPQSFVSAGLGTEAEFDLMVFFMEAFQSQSPMFVGYILREVTYYMVKSLPSADAKYLYKELEEYSKYNSFGDNEEVEKVMNNALERATRFLQKSRISISQYKSQYDLSMATLASHCRSGSFYDGWEFCPITHFLIR